MLLEVWHHLLKGNFLEGKQNHCMDHLIYTLVKESTEKIAKDAVVVSDEPGRFYVNLQASDLLELADEQREGPG
ncbi:hypothetical protein EWM64_g9831 [Hericium alpestre]|uniref:Uncharacterized protein n=1 Tax=Hericium alpestre TaxID=135208 RepID=A0A4Y9ZHS1_9AGAM|nr:hypothetical protein EWM64_g9831 [Hericium alpestre]